MILITAIIIIAILVFYPKVWRYVENCKEDDSDITKRNI